MRPDAHVQRTSILAVSSYGWRAGSTRVRLKDWLDHLGLDAEWAHYAGFADNRPRRLLQHPLKTLRAENAVRRLPVSEGPVILSREASPFSRGEVETTILSNAVRGIYDLDDALFHDHGLARRLFGGPYKFHAAAAAADVVIAGNDYLADWASTRASDVRIIPSCVDPNRYVPKSDWDFPREGARLVWLGSPSTERYVEQISDALSTVLSSENASLTMISGSARASHLGTAEGMTHRVTWNERTVAQELASADIAIAPLDDTPFSRGKCAYKLLQYAATALPMIGSPVGANSLALSRFDGLSAESPSEWVDGLRQLISESAHRRSMRGRAGLQGVRECYSFEAWEAEWQAAVFGQAGQ